MQVSPQFPVRRALSLEEEQISRKLPDFPEDHAAAVWKESTRRSDLREGSNHFPRTGSAASGAPLVPVAPPVPAPGCRMHSCAWEILALISPGFPAAGWGTSQPPGRNTGTQNGVPPLRHGTLPDLLPVRDWRKYPELDREGRQGSTEPHSPMLWRATSP